MANGINRFDQAQPAQDNYFNTFVPMPMEQLTALGMSRKQDLEKNQAMIDKAYNDVLNIQAIPGSKDETLLKTNIVPAMTDIAMKYSTVDLTDPQQMANMRRELRTRIDPNLINRIEQSHAGYLRYHQQVDRLSQEGKYSRQLDTANPTNWDSSTMGAFSASPEAYEGKASLFEPYLNNLRPRDYIDAAHGIIRSEIKPEDVDRLASANAADLVNTPKGQQELRLFKMNYPSVAQRLGSDEQVMRHLMNDFGQDRVGSTMKALPAGWGKEYSPRAVKEGVKYPLTGTGPGEVQNFNSIGDYQNEIQNLKQSGDTESAKDMQIKLDATLNKYNLPKESDNPLYQGGIKKFLNKTLPDFVENAGAWPRTPTNQDTEFDTNIKKALTDLSSVVSTKTSFGSPNFPSKSLMDEDLATGQKKGPSEMIDISNNMISNPSNFELISINGEKPPKNKKLPGVIGSLQTKDMIDLSFDKMPDKRTLYKPIATMSYQDPKKGVVSVRVAINDENQRRAFATLAANRGDYEAEAAMNNSLATATIENANLDTPKTYYVHGAHGKIPITIGRNDQGGFTVTAPEDKPDGTRGPGSMDVNTRKEAISIIYQYMANNRNPKVKTGEPSSLFSEK